MDLSASRPTRFCSNTRCRTFAWSEQIIDLDGTRRITDVLPTYVPSYPCRSGFGFMHYINIIVLHIDIVLPFIILYLDIE